MEETETKMAVEKNKQEVKYQWIKGDRFGDIVTVDDNPKDNEWLYFTDNSRINPDLIDEFLLKVERDRDILNVSDSNVNANTKPIAKQVQEPDEPVKEASIMGKMITKMSKKNVVNVPIKLNLNIPTPALHAMLSEGMEEEDLNDEIMEVALQQIEINNLTEYLKENISTFLSEYYS